VNAIASEHIVEIFDFVEEGADKFFVMELLEGSALSEEMGRGQLGFERSLHIALQLASALEAVHKAGILHRDLKPDNIMLTTRAGVTDFVKLLDFGIAKVLDEEAFDDSKIANDTSDGAVMGTPAYVSPEEELDYRADIYAFGLLLFQMLTGERPFRSRSLPELVLKQMTEKPPSISDMFDAPDIPVALDSLVRRCLEKDRALRPPTMGHVRAELEMARDGADDGDDDVFADATSSSAIRAGTGEIAPEPVELGLERPWESPAALAAAGALGLILLATSVWAGVTTGDDAPAGAAGQAALPDAESPRARLIKRIDAGEAPEVLALFENVPAEERSPGDDLMRGHALAKLDRGEGGLQEREAETAMNVLRAARSEDVRPPLCALLGDPGWWPRHHALKVLSDRKEDEDVDREKLAITDLETGPKCGTRRYGLSQLKEHGGSKEALAAIKRAGQRKDNGCIKKKQLKEASAAVKARVAP
jgi:serine/threonine-protein kinase